MNQIKEGLKNPDVHLAAANETPLVEKIWNKVTFNNDEDSKPESEPESVITPAPPPIITPPPAPRDTSKVHSSDFG
jgi:hypothetical protein